MKTLLDELQWKEDCLLGRAPGEQQTLFQARLLADPEFRKDIHWQCQAYGYIREYGRRQLRDELEGIHRMLFTEPQHRLFRNRVMAFFRR
ncbi:hypothetical protein SAMN05421747_101537 [Parapedobacter composti]|uniref:Uncharacterized protein n=1 Tax=Parapedobacter composti TaxID=623281 RepID=A0A1I1EEK4_9SPHI|nr:hypothetical protein [Parapedobacter composti]SFB85589.1 hypothetical protein SAMN05421747_101537 [Parapedobacter composti]